MPVKTHVTKIEATGAGSVLVSVVLESDLGPIELEIEASLEADARTQDPIIHALDEVREKLLTFGADLQAEMKAPNILTRMVHLSLPDEAAEADDVTNND